MADKKTKVDIAVRATGTKRTSDRLKQVTRQQTRLGQASASAGRQFSSQAQGLGGLVSAYAGAAATIFAITQAFSALNRAAQAEQTVQGVNALATAIGESGPEIISGLQEITKGQLSVAEAAKAANLALSSGFNADQISELADIATKASRALGVPLQQAFERLTRGVVKLEPELLDELGIFTRIEPAAERYASQLGKTASQLSNFEKRQAFANAVAEEGAEKFKAIDTETTTTAEQLEKFSATLQDVGQKFGVAIAGFVGPLAEFLSAPTAAIATFGILVKTVLGTAIRELQQKVQAIGPASIAAADGFAEFTLKGKALQKANAAVSSSLAGIRPNIAGVSAGSKKLVSDLIKQGRASALSKAQAADLARELVKVKANTISAGLAIRGNADASAANAAKVKALDAAITGLNARLSATTVIGAKAAKVISFLGIAAAKASAGVLRLVGAFGTVVTVISIVVLAGSAILSFFGVLDDTLEALRAGFRRFQDALGQTRELQAYRDIAEELDISLDTLGKRGAESIRSFAEATGVSFKKASEELRQFQDGTTALAEFQNLGGGANQLRAQFEDMGTDRVFVRQQGMVAITRQMTEEEKKQRVERQKNALNILQFQKVSVNLNEAIQSGTASIEQLDKRRIAAQTKLNDLKGTERKIAEGVLNQLSDQVRVQQANLKLRSQIEKTFSAQLKAADKINDLLSVQTDGTIKLAKSADEQKANQVAQLGLAIKLGREKTGDAALDKQRAQTAQTAQNILGGILIQNLQTAKKITDDLEKRILKIRQEISLEKEKRNILTSKSVITQEKTIEDIRRERVLQAKNELDSIRKIQVIQDKMGQGVRQRTGQGRLDIMSGPLSNLFTNEQRTEVKLKLAEENVRFLNELDTRRINEIRVDAQERQKENQKQKDFLIAQRAREDQLRSAESALDRAKIESDGKNAIANLKSTTERIKLLGEEAKMLAENRVELSVIFTKFANEVAIAADPKAFRARASTEIIRAIGQDRGFADFAAGIGVKTRRNKRTREIEFQGNVTLDQLARLEAERARLGSRSKADSMLAESEEFIASAGRNLKTLTSGVVEKTTQSLETLKEKDRTTAASIQATRELEDERLKTKEAKAAQADAAELAQLQLNIQARNQELDIMKKFENMLNNTFVGIVQGATGIIKNDFKKGIEDLTMSLIDGSFQLGNAAQSFRNFIGSLLNQIARLTLQKAVAGPISDVLGSVIGAGFSGLFGGYSASSFQSVSAAGTTNVPMSARVGPAFGGMIGGEVKKMAGGGFVGRDRVPAMLEPGEFIIRRPMAKAIGGAVLNGMNMTGNVPQQPVVVNIKNEGTPQEAQAQQPRIDADKIVVDIVTRDLRNNGPIRQSLRGGSM